MTDLGVPTPRVPQSFLAVLTRAMTQWGRGALLEGAIAIEHLVDEVLATYLAAPDRDLLLRGTVLSQMPMARKFDVLDDVLASADLVREYETVVASIRHLMRVRNLLVHADGPHDGITAAALGNSDADPSDEGMWFRRYRRGAVQWKQVLPRELGTIIETARDAPASLEELRDRLAAM